MSREKVIIIKNEYYCQIYWAEKIVTSGYKIQTEKSYTSLVLN